MEHFRTIIEPNALYREAGIRGVEIGTVMFGQHPDGHESGGHA